MEGYPRNYNFIPEVGTSQELLELIGDFKFVIKAEDVG